MQAQTTNSKVSKPILRIVRNRYFHHSKISENKFLQIIQLFSFDMTATEIASISGVSRTTVNYLLMEVRKKIALWSDSESPLGRTEQNEELFDQIEVLGMVRIGQKIYLKPVHELMSETLKVIHRRSKSGWKIIKASGLHKKHCGLLDLQGIRFVNIVQSNAKKEKTKRSSPDCSKAFWNLVKNKMSKCRGVHKSCAYLHMKECEFRFNHRKSNLYSALLQIIRDNPIVRNPN